MRKLSVLGASLAVGIVTAVTAQPAQADVVRTANGAIHRTCTGSAVVRCIGYEWRQEAYANAPVYYRPYAYIRDATGGTNYSVRVKDVKLYRAGTLVLRVDDYDGWFDVSDSVRDGVVWRQQSYAGQRFSTRATFGWDTATTSPTHQTLSYG